MRKLPMNPYTLSDSMLDVLLAEDVPAGDATTFTLGIAEKPARIEFAARYEMVVCGTEEAARMGTMRGLAVAVEPVASGTRVESGRLLLALEGPAGAAFQVWKTAQVLVEYLSGIATCTAGIVDAAYRGNPAVGVVCTRKNFPGTKAGAVKAVLCGGASPHRLSLSETLLVFPHHRVFLSTEETPAEVVSRLRTRWPERMVTVEVVSVAEALEWGEAGADVLQLEKMPPEDIAAIRVRVPGVRLAPAGGINATNAEAYAVAGADLLVTSAPYSAAPKDVCVTFRPLHD